MNSDLSQNSLCLLSGDTPEAILTAIYMAFASRLAEDRISIELSGNAQLAFFQLRQEVTPSYETADRVASSIRRKLGPEVWETVEGALQAASADKADAIFHFLKYCFRKAGADAKRPFVSGRQLTWDLTEPAVMRVFELNRKARNEAHLLLGFARFAPVGDRFYLCRLSPVNDVLSILADHFSARLNTQAFIIYDERRQKSAVYAPGQTWYFVEGPLKEAAALPEKQDYYEELWRTFFQTIAIPERLNPICQRTHCPLHFRAHMTEFRT